MSFGPQEICRVCGGINYEGRIVCRRCEEPDRLGEPMPQENVSPQADGMQRSMGEKP